MLSTAATNFFYIPDSTQILFLSLHNHNVAREMMIKARGIITLINFKQKSITQF